MAVRQQQLQYVYGIGDNLLPMPPLPIVANRDPRSSDFAQPGTIWINSSDDTIWMLATITANSANWQTSPASGVGIFSSVQVTTGDLDVDQGDVNITLGNLDVAAGNTTLAGDLTVGGTATFNGDIDFASAALIDLTSTLDAAPSILLEANGGTSEQVKLFSNQGTSVSSIYLLSDVGGLTLRATGLASADAINLEAPAGGIDMDAALQINIASSQNAASAIVVSASAGGIDILAAGAAGEDIDITNTAGSVNIAGGEAASDAIFIDASNAAGGIVFNAGSGGISEIVSAGNIALVTSGSGDILITAEDDLSLNSNNIIALANDDSGQVINIGSDLGENIINIGNNITATEITITSGTGNTTFATTGSTIIDSTGGIEINSSAGSILVGNDAVAQAIGIGTGAAARTITLGNVTGATAVNVNSGTGGINLSSAGIFTLDAVTDTQASPTAASTIDANVGSVTFTGFTTAAAGTQDFTITNALVTTSSQILCTVCNEGANDAQINIRRITRAAGSFVVKVVNDGAAALNGNVTITFIVLN